MKKGRAGKTATEGTVATACVATLSVATAILILGIIKMHTMRRMRVQTADITATIVRVVRFSSAASSSSGRLSVKPSPAIASISLDPMTPALTKRTRVKAIIRRLVKMTVSHAMNPAAYRITISQLKERTTGRMAPQMRQTIHAFPRSAMARSSTCPAALTLRLMEVSTFLAASGSRGMPLAHWVLPQSDLDLVASVRHSPVSQRSYEVLTTGPKYWQLSY
mmetsp:Transcript_14656/g.46630  ORF Transcript_14656/g.46630 Transcript_14656/m.46630 type:complete len:221 (+) Transcript_14656:1114-1776(+)